MQNSRPLQSPQSVNVPGNDSEGEDEDKDEEGPSSELAEAEMKKLEGIMCCKCHKTLCGKRRDGSGIRICDGCHRCFHSRCCQSSNAKGRKGGRDLSSTEEGEGDEELWFHNDQCRAFYQKLSTLHGYKGRESSGAGRPSYASGVSCLRMFSPEVAKKEIADKARENKEEGEEEDEEVSNLDQDKITSSQGLHHASSVLSDGFGPLVGGAVMSSDFVAVTYNDKERLAALESAAEAMLAAEERETKKYSEVGSTSKPSPFNREGKELISPSDLSQMLQNGQGIEMRTFDDADAELLSSGPYAYGAVSAATLDIFGPDLAMMDLIATRDDVKGKGHAKILVDEIEQALSAVGVQSLLVAVSSTDHESQEVWLGGKKGKGTIGKGYKRIGRAELGKLKSQWPHFSAADELVYFSKNIKKGR